MKAPGRLARTTPRRRRAACALSHDALDPSRSYPTDPTQPDPVPDRAYLPRFSLLSMLSLGAGTRITAELLRHQQERRFSGRRSERM